MFYDNSKGRAFGILHQLISLTDLCARHADWILEEGPYDALLALGCRQTSVVSEEVSVHRQQVVQRKRTNRRLIAYR